MKPLADRPGDRQAIKRRVPSTDLVAVTATGVVLAECTPEDVTVVDRGGNVVEGDLAPTSELDLHLAVLASSGAGAVVHTHAPYATAVGCVRDDLPVLHYQQIRLGGEIRVAPYATFGTPELAASVVEALRDRSAALMANHGAVTTARRWTRPSRTRSCSSGAAGSL